MHGQQNMKKKLSILFIILQVHSTRFGCQPHPSSGVHKTVTTAAGTGHIFFAATSLQRGHITGGQLPPSNVTTLKGGSCTNIWPVPEAVVTVLCTPDDGCGWHPKHVEWTCRIINRLLCVASRWKIIKYILSAMQGTMNIKIFSACYLDAPLFWYLLV